MPRNPRRNITRVERTGAAGTPVGGWQVRMQRQRERHCKLFSDSTYGGKLAALRSAKAYRDQVDAQSRKMNAADKSLFPSESNRSGIVGVRQHQQIDRRGDYEYHYWYWVAQWTDGHGKRRTKSYAVEKYGDAKAFRLAWEARKEGVRKANR